VAPLPEGEPMFDPELLTIHPERFLAAERIREKGLELTTEELPFSTAVVIDRWEDDEEKGLIRIYASILVERPGQKKIVVGRLGQMIKAIGTAARLDLARAGRATWIAQGLELSSPQIRRCARCVSVAGVRRWEISDSWSGICALADINDAGRWSPDRPAWGRERAEAQGSTFTELCTETGSVAPSNFTLKSRLTTQPASESFP
jgi:KH domain-containing protein